MGMDGPELRRAHLVVDRTHHEGVDGTVDGLLPGDDDVLSAVRPATAADDTPCVNLSG